MGTLLNQYSPGYFSIFGLVCSFLLFCMYALYFSLYICVGSYVDIIVGMSRSSSYGSISKVVVAYIFAMSTLHVVPVTCGSMSLHSYIS